MRAGGQYDLNKPTPGSPVRADLIAALVDFVTANGQLPQQGGQFQSTGVSTSRATVKAIDKWFEAYTTEVDDVPEYSLLQVLDAEVSAASPGEVRLRVGPPNGAAGALLCVNEHYAIAGEGDGHVRLVQPGKPVRARVGDAPGFGDSAGPVSGQYVGESPGDGLVVLTPIAADQVNNVEDVYFVMGDLAPASDSGGDLPPGVSCDESNCTEAEPISGGTVCCDEHDTRTAVIPLPFTPLDDADAPITEFVFTHVAGDLWSTAEFFRACDGGNGTYRLDRTLFRDADDRRQSRVELITVASGGCDLVCAVYESCCFIRCPCEQEHKLVDWRGGDFPGDFAGRICLKPDQPDDDEEAACAAEPPAAICGGATVAMPVAWEADLSGFDGVVCSASGGADAATNVWKYRGQNDPDSFCGTVATPTTNVDVNGTHLCIQGEGGGGSTWADMCSVDPATLYHKWIPGYIGGVYRPQKIVLAIECGRICATVFASTWCFSAGCIKRMATYSVEIDTTGMTADEIACWINQEHTLSHTPVAEDCADDDPCFNCRDPEPARFPGAACFISPDSIVIRPLGAGGTGECDPPPISESVWCHDGPPATHSGACPDDECDEYGYGGGGGGGGGCTGGCTLEWHEGEGWEAVESTCFGTGDCAGGQHCACQHPGRDGEFNNEVITVDCGCCTTESSGVCTD